MQQKLDLLHLPQRPAGIHRAEELTSPVFPERGWGAHMGQGLPAAHSPSLCPDAVQELPPTAGDSWLHMT